MSDNFLDDPYNTNVIPGDYNQNVQHDSDSTSSFINMLDQDIIVSNQTTSNIDNTSSSQLACELMAPESAVSTSSFVASKTVTANLHARPARASNQPSVHGNHSIGTGLLQAIQAHLPTVVAVEQRSASIHYQLDDNSRFTDDEHSATLSSLSHSFQHCFNNPVLDLLVVVLNPAQSVCLYRGFFSGTPQLAGELLNLSGKRWNSLISNNDENSWDSHCKSVLDNFYESGNSGSNSQWSTKFEAGPVIRCRLRASSSSPNNGMRSNSGGHYHSQQQQQQFSYFFVQPASYAMRLDGTDLDSPDPESPDLGVYSGEAGSSINSGPASSGIYLVSYINIVRECETEFALKGSAAASLQKVITNSAANKAGLSVPVPACLPSTVVSSKAQMSSQMARSTSLTAPVQLLSVNTSSSSPMFPDPYYSHQQQQTHSMTYANRPNYSQQQQRLSVGTGSHYLAAAQPSRLLTSQQQQQQQSSLQYILENSPQLYSSSQTKTHLMQPQQPPMYSYYQQQQLNMSPYMPPSQRLHHHHQYSPNGILVSSDQQQQHQYYHQQQQNLMEPTQRIFAVQHSVPSSSTSCPSSSVSSSSSSSATTRLMTQPQLYHQHQAYLQSDPSRSQSALPSLPPLQSHLHMQHHQRQQQELFADTDWISDSLLGATSVNSSFTDPTASINDSSLIPFDIVEEILQAEEAKSESLKPVVSAVSTQNLQQLPSSQIHSSFLLNPDTATGSSSSTSTAVDSSMVFNIDDFVYLRPTASDSRPASVASQQQQPLTMEEAVPVHTPSPVPASPSTPGAKVNSSHNKSQGSRSSSSSSATDIKIQRPKHPILNLKTETLQKLTSNQRQQIKKFVNQYKSGVISKPAVYQHIMDFLANTLGNSTFKEQVMEFWSNKQQKPGPSDNDSGHSGMSYSHVVRSPEEGPGISPTEHAAQSTTDMEEDGGVMRCPVKRQSGRSRSGGGGDCIAVNSVTSTTTGTGVLEKLLNERDSGAAAANCSPPDTAAAISAGYTRFNIASTSKNQLTLDQLLIDDDCSPFCCDDTGPSTKKTVHGPLGVASVSATSSNRWSQPSTPCLSSTGSGTSSTGNGGGGTMGVLESLLNQKNPGLSTLRQKSTDSILRHSRHPSATSRQNSQDSHHTDEYSDLTDKDSAGSAKKNSLLITLLNNPSSNQITDKNGVRTTQYGKTFEEQGSATKRRRTSSGLSSANVQIKKETSNHALQNSDVFDFQSETHQSNMSPTGGLYSSTPKRRHNTNSGGSSGSMSESGRKRQHSALDGTRPLEDKSTVILTSLLETKPHYVQPQSQQTPSYQQQQQQLPDDMLSIDDIKIDDFDLDNIMELANECAVGGGYGTSGTGASVGYETTMLPGPPPPPQYPRHLLGAMHEHDNFIPVYSEVGPIIKSDPINMSAVSKQSVLRLSDNSGFILSALQQQQPVSSCVSATATASGGAFVVSGTSLSGHSGGSSSSSLSSLTGEALDTERQRLLRQQQMQKLSMAKSCGEHINKPLSLDKFSKQMKEVGPNVTVEISPGVDGRIKPRTSIGKSPAVVTSTGVCSPLMPLIGSDISTTVASSPSVSSPASMSNTSIPSHSSCLLPPDPQHSTRTSLVSSTVPTSAAVSIPNVNRQQVREGLRLLVSSRSAQNSALKGGHTILPLSYRQPQAPSGSSTLAELVTAAPGLLSSSSTKYSVPPATATSTTSSSSTTDILEDSLVNDVFGLEELVSNKSREPLSEKRTQSFGVSRSISSVSVPHHHHHHHAQHVHHHHHVDVGAAEHRYHHHHHHHPIASSSTSVADPSIVNNSSSTGNSTVPRPTKIAKTASVGPNSGLLETLLSR